MCTENNYHLLYMMLCLQANQMIAFLMVSPHTQTHSISFEMNLSTRELGSHVTKQHYSPGWIEVLHHNYLSTNKQMC